MSHAVQQVALGIKKKCLKEEDVDEKLIEQCLYTHNSPSPDLLIRTSGEVRLSDFLLWQTSYSSIYFTNVLWPEFSLKDLCLAILHYQRNLPKIKVSKLLIFFRLLNFLLTAIN
jgi:ditrans,polycis-polyprenyl diphosphate synthase